MRIPFFRKAEAVIPKPELAAEDRYAIYLEEKKRIERGSRSGRFWKFMFFAACVCGAFWVGRLTATPHRTPTRVSIKPDGAPPCQVVHVRGHVARGKWVEPYDRSCPDSDPTNNWSSKGNSNPETGKPGKR